MVFRMSHEYKHPWPEPGSFYSEVGIREYGALSSAWTEHLASDQDVAGSNPAAPIRFRDGGDTRDSDALLIKEFPFVL